MKVNHSVPKDIPLFLKLYRFNLLHASDEEFRQEHKRLVRSILSAAVIGSKRKRAFIEQMSGVFNECKRERKSR